jgi:hypothetical protein
MSLEQSTEKIGTDNEQVIGKEYIDTVRFPQVSNIKEEIRRIQQLISQITKEPIPSALSGKAPGKTSSKRGVFVTIEKRNRAKQILKKPPTKIQRNHVIPRSPLDKLRPR